MTSEDSTLSYLPLAHIFDRIVEEFTLYSGARIGYYQVPAWDFWKAGCSSMLDSISRPQPAAACCSLHVSRQTKCEAVMQATAQVSKSGLVSYVLETLQTTRLLSWQGNPKKITEDVAALRPSLFIAVPRVLERIQAGIDAKVHSWRHFVAPGSISKQLLAPNERAFVSLSCLGAAASLHLHRGRCLRLRVLLVWQVKGKGLLTRLIFSLAFRWKQFRIHMGAPVESVSPPTCAMFVMDGT